MLLEHHERNLDAWTRVEKTQEEAVASAHQIDESLKNRVIPSLSVLAKSQSDALKLSKQLLKESSEVQAKLNNGFRETHKSLLLARDSISAVRTDLGALHGYAQKAFQASIERSERMLGLLDRLESSQIERFDAIARAQAQLLSEWSTGLSAAQKDLDSLRNSALDARERHGELISMISGLGVAIDRVAGSAVVASSTLRICGVYFSTLVAFVLGSVFVGWGAKIRVAVLVLGPLPFLASSRLGQFAQIPMDRALAILCSATIGIIIYVAWNSFGSEKRAAKVAEEKREADEAFRTLILRRIVEDGNRPVAAIQAEEEEPEERVRKPVKRTLRKTSARKKSRDAEIDAE